MRSQRAVWNLLDTWEAPPPSAYFDTRLRSRLENVPARSWWRHAFSLPLATAGTLVLAALLINVPHRPPSPGFSAQPPRMVQLADVQQIDQALDDLQLLHQLDKTQDEE
jgi:hypothetical protein